MGSSSLTEDESSIDYDLTCVNCDDISASDSISSSETDEDISGDYEPKEFSEDEYYEYYEDDDECDDNEINSLIEHVRSNKKSSSKNRKQPKTTLKDVNAILKDYTDIFQSMSKSQTSSIPLAVESYKQSLLDIINDPKKLEEKTEKYRKLFEKCKFSEKDFKEGFETILFLLNGDLDNNQEHPEVSKEEWDEDQKIIQETLNKYKS